MEEITRQLETAKSKYNDVDFKTDVFFNEKPPDPIVAFVIGGILSVAGVIMWVHRYNKLRDDMAAKDPPIILKGNSQMRALISCAIDSDSPFYVIVSYGAASFLFLGGIQLNYEWTLLAMIIVYVASAVGETIRVLLAFQSAKSLGDVVVTSALMASKVRGVSTDLRPSNVYEDLGRGRTIVFMVFITQVILIAFVCVDIYESDTTNCRDGSGNCPVGGTMGSWSFYVLGIFMACVFQLGPKTNFGQSEQNPAYWLQLLLATKQSGARITWYDPVQDKTKFRELHSGDLRTWARFFMSFLINGVGFHILVHALPIQVASQSSLTGVVFRAVGMMYLVDLDDTPGYTLKIEQKEEEKKKEEEPKKVNPEGPVAPSPAMDAAVVEGEAFKIIEEARAKLDALARGEKTNRRVTNQGLLAAGALANAGEFEDGDAQAQSRGLPLGNTDAPKGKKDSSGAAAGAAGAEENEANDAGADEGVATA